MSWSSMGIKDRVWIGTGVLAGAAVALFVLMGARGAAELRTECGGERFDQSHQAWSTELSRFVEDGRVDYDEWRKDRRGLESYLDDLRGVCGAEVESWSVAEKQAYWINVYNAYTVQLILNHYPVQSILKIGWYPTAAWKKRVVDVPAWNGKTLSLEQVEHTILRETLMDARLHAALVCASKSCPPLRDEAFRGVDLDAQLADQSRAFVNDASKNWIDEAGVLHLSKIFKWYQEDFSETGGEGSALAFVQKHAAYSVPDDIKFRYAPYDWALNE